MQPERLLHGMHKVFSHDLPNQLVALQSLLQMLQMEESERLSKDGQEYVQRLQKVSQRTSAMVRFLKEMGRLHAYVGKKETLALSMLEREIQAALKQQFPQTQFAFDWQWTVPSVVGDYRTFVQAVIEILTCLVPASGQTCRLQAGTEELGNQTDIHFLLESDPRANDNGPSLLPDRAVPPALEQRMEMVLAREWLAVSEAALDVTDQGNGGSRFTLRVPNR